jgi:hypothetical protein
MRPKQFRLKRNTQYTRDHVRALRIGYDPYNAFSCNGDREKTKAAMRIAWPVLREAAFYLAEDWTPYMLPNAFFMFDENCPEEWRDRTWQYGGAVKVRKFERESTSYLRTQGVIPTVEEMHSDDYIRRNHQYLKPVRRKLRMTDIRRKTASRDAPGLTGTSEAMQYHPQNEMKI